MTVESVLAAAGAPLDDRGTDLSAAGQLLDRKADLTRQALSIALVVARVKAELAGSRSLGLDRSLQRRVAKLFGVERLKTEEATLAAAADTAKASRVATAALIAGYDQRLKIASERLHEAERQAARLDKRAAEFRRLRASGIATTTILANHEFSAMTLERLRLASVSELVNLRAARENAVQEASVAAAKQRLRLDGELRDALDRQSAVDMQAGNVERRLAQLSNQRSPASQLAGLSTVIRRRTGNSGRIAITAQAGTELQPGDIVVVRLKLPGDAIRPAPSKVAER